MPISSSKSQYVSDGGQNYGGIGTKDIDDLFNQATTEFDAAKATDLTYQIDQKIWEEGVSAPLYQQPDIVVEKSNIANMGAKGFADIRYEDIGFKK